jgi:hypothetical protein
LAEPALLGEGGVGLSAVALVHPGAARSRQRSLRPANEKIRHDRRASQSNKRRALLRQVSHRVAEADFGVKRRQNRWG